MRQYLKFIVNFLKPAKLITDNFGIIYYCNSTDALANHIRSKGIYDEYQTIQSFIKKNLTQLRTAIDVGANHGFVTLPLAHEFFKVISFEPDPENFKALNKNVNLNKYPNIVINQCGISNKDTYLELAINRVIDGDGLINSGISSFEVGNRVFSRGFIQVPVTTLDLYCQKNSISDIDFIKIDTEGHEYFVLLGMLKIIEKNKPLIFYEFSPTIDARLGVDQRFNCFNLLEKKGYAHFMESHGELLKISSDEMQQLEEDINLFAIHKSQ